MDTDYYLSLLAGEVSINPVSLGAIVALLTASLLLIVSAFVSGSEIAFFSLKPNDLEEIELGDHKSDKTVSSLLEESERLLATILIVNNFVNVGVVTLCGFFFESVFDFSKSPLLGFIFLTVVLTFILLLFGEIIPKVYAGKKALSFSRFSASGLSFFKSLCYPLATILIRSTNIVNKHVASLGHQSQTISMDELSQALELTSDEEMKDEKDILEGVIRFKDKEASEVMTSRIDICDINIRCTFKEVLDMIREYGYSRIPVYAESRDNIRGILYIKDLLLHLDKPDSFRWQSLIRPAFFVPETKKIDNLLEDFKTGRIHMAIVVDEYGGVSGLVTIEDVVEEIVGNISDEYDDEEEQSYSKIDDSNYEFIAKTSLIDFYRITGVNEEEFEKIAGEVDTLAGFLLEIKGDFPIKGEKLSFNNYDFTILAVDNRRILRVLFHINSENND